MKIRFSMEQNNNTQDNLQNANQTLETLETWDNWEEVTKRTFGNDYKIY